jgi:hypothetical protein
LKAEIYELFALTSTPRKENLIRHHLLDKP